MPIDSEECVLVLGAQGRPPAAAPHVAVLLAPAAHCCFVDTGDFRELPVREPLGLLHLQQRDPLCACEPGPAPVGLRLGRQLAG